MGPVAAILSVLSGGPCRKILSYVNICEFWRKGPKKVGGSFFKDSLKVFGTILTLGIILLKCGLNRGNAGKAVQIPEREEECCMDRTTPSKASGMTGMCAEPELFFIINPASHSGKGLRLWQKAEALLRSQGIVYEAFFRKEEATSPGSPDSSLYPCRTAGSGLS